MNKNEFLLVLREQLEGRLSQSTIEEHIRYYDQYITTEIQMGKSEKQVMEDLGSPIFIAKTLSDVAANAPDYDGSYGDDSYDSAYHGAYESYEGRTGSGTVYEDYEEEKDGIGHKIQTFLLESGILKILIPILIMVILFFAVGILGTVAFIVLRFLSPVIFIVVLYYLFQNLRGR